MKFKKGKNLTVLHDCRKRNGRMWSLSFVPLKGGLQGHVAAHEGRKPSAGDYLALSNPNGGAALYRVDSVDLCMNIDPPNMWMAKVTFVKPKDAPKRIRENQLPL